VIITCPKCFSADDVLPRGEVQEGVTDELLEPLNRCVDASDPLVEYGIVEHRPRT
jgi:hypothetical protein